MYFYELHESEGDLFTDVLLVHDAEYDEESFLEVVLEARGAVIESFEEDTLVEAVAGELERRHGFTFVHDARLTASVDVSKDEGVTSLSELTEDEDEDFDFDDEGEDDDGTGPAAGFRSLVVDMDRTTDLN